MIRLNNIDKWQLLESGKAITFESPLPRRVRIEVNSPAPATLHYVDGNGEATFLAQVNGRGVIEFGSVGEFALTAEGDVWFYTVDGEDFSFSIPDAVVLTKLVERRARNPEVERIEYMMRRNFEMLRQQQADELERVFRERERAAAAAAKLPAAPSDGGAGDGKLVAAGVAGGDAGNNAAATGSEGGAKK